MNIKELIKNVIEEINEDLDTPIEINDEVVLIGDGAVLDSFDFVNLTVLIEEMVSDEFDKEITLVNEKAFSKKNSPFRNIEALTNYIQELLGE